MRIFALKTIKKFWENHSDSEPSLRRWYKKVEEKNYKSLLEITRDFPNSDAVGSDRIVFNIKGNDYRLVAGFNFDFQLCYVKFIGTHSEYDRIDVKTIEFN
jgi:mRNA interferase HigB